MQSKEKPNSLIGGQSNRRQYRPCVRCFYFYNCRFQGRHGTSQRRRNEDPDSVHTESMFTSPGGSAGNTTFALSRMGLASKFLGKTGNCQQVASGTAINLKILGGNSRSFKIANQANGHCLSMVTPDGERTMRTDLGAAMLLSPEEISVEDFTDCHHAHFEGYLLFNEALTKIA